ILNHQADQGGRFGEIAITLGYLTETQVKELLLLQLESRPKLGEVLVERDVLQQEQLQQLLDRYHARRLADALGPVPEAEVEEWPADATSHARVLAASATKEATG